MGRHSALFSSRRRSVFASSAALIGAPCQPFAFASIALTGPRLRTSHCDAASLRCAARPRGLTLGRDAAYLSPSAATCVALHHDSPMQILFADYDFPDIELEREIFAGAGLDLKLAQCTQEAQVIEAARGCAGILLQYAPITAGVVAALPELGIVSRIGAGFDTVDVEACRAHGVWVANSPDYGVGEVATHALALALASPAQRRPLPRRHPRRPLALPVVGNAAAACRTHARHRRPRPDRQADGPRVAQRLQARRRVRSAADRRRLSRVRRAGASLLEALAGQADVVSLHTPLDATTRGMIDAAILRGGEAGTDARQHVARRGRRPRPICSRRSMLEYCGAPRWTCCPRSRSRAIRGCWPIRVSS